MLGLKLGHRRQTFVCASAAEYVRKDGTKSQILTWLSDCPNCDASFPQTTGMTVDVSRLVRHCKRHRPKKPGGPT